MNAIDPPMRRPMNVLGSATLICVRGSWKRSLPTAFRFELGADRLDERCEEGDRGDDRRADREALGDGLGGVADRVEAHHDALGLAVNSPDISAMPAALSATGPKVSSDDDDAGRGEHAHAGEGDEVEDELEVSAAECDRSADRDRDRDDRPHRRLETRGDARQHGGRGAGAGRLGDLTDRARLGGGEVLGEPADDLCEHEADHDGGETLANRGSRACPRRCRRRRARRRACRPR